MKNSRKNSKQKNAPDLAPDEQARKELGRCATTSTKLLTKLNKNKCKVLKIKDFLKVSRKVRNYRNQGETL